MFVHHPISKSSTCFFLYNDFHQPFCFAKKRVFFQIPSSGQAFWVDLWVQIPPNPFGVWIPREWQTSRFCEAETWVARQLMNLLEVSSKKFPANLSLTGQVNVVEMGVGLDGWMDSWPYFGWDDYYRYNLVLLMFCRNLRLVTPWKMNGWDMRFQNRFTWVGKWFFWPSLHSRIPAIN